MIEAKLQKGYKYQAIYIDDMPVANIIGFADVSKSISELKPFTVNIRDVNNFPIGLYHVESIEWKEVEG